MAKKLKPVGEIVSAATPAPDPAEVVITASVEPLDEPAGDEPIAASIEPIDEHREPDDPIVVSVDPVSEQPERLSSDDRGDPQGRVLAVGGSTVMARLPGSCVNCGQVGFTITLIATDRYQCSQCKHVWTSAEEQAPFRSHLK